LGWDGKIPPTNKCKKINPDLKTQIKIVYLKGVELVIKNKL
jgi:hypothetical protein